MKLSEVKKKNMVKLLEKESEKENSKIPILLAS